MNKATIVAAEPLLHLPEARRVIFDCGHALVLDEQWHVGMLRQCDACWRHESKITDIIGKDRAGEPMLVLYLACGDIMWRAPTPWCPDEAAAQAWVGTSTPCNGPRCREGR